MKADKSFWISVLKVLYKVLPFVISALGGATVTAAVSGCKCGSVISFVSPAV